MERENIAEINTEIITETIEVKIEFDQSEKVSNNLSSESEVKVGLLSEESGVLTDSGQASEIEFLDFQTGNDGNTPNEENERDFFVANAPSTSKSPQE